MLDKTSWMPKEPIKVVYFDVDSTLSQIEGIDELAELTGVGPQVKAMTERCMETTGLSVDVYRQRLELIKPTQKMMDDLAQKYLLNITPGAKEVIGVLLQLGKDVKIISAGIQISLLPLAKALGIFEKNVLAVNVFFDQQGHYRSFDELSPLVRAMGKKDLIEKVTPYDTTLLIGDGVSDLDAQAIVTRFVGYGNVKVREKVRDQADFYIESRDLWGLLPLVLTAEEVETLSGEAKVHYLQGLKELDSGQVTFRERDHVQDCGCR